MQKSRGPQAPKSKAKQGLIVKQERPNKNAHAFSQSDAPPQPTSLKEQAYEQMLERIQSGTFAPHSALSERQLAEILGMSKTPIRAALEKLEAQGLVTVSPQRGIMIRELSAREIGELFDVRMAIEPFVVERLTQRTWTVEQRNQLKANLKAQRVAVAAEDSLAATKLDIEFHRSMAEVLDNREIVSLLEKCFNKLHRSVLHINTQVPGRLRKSFDDHELIAQLISGGDSKKAMEAMREHLRYGRQFLLGIE